MIGSRTKFGMRVGLVFALLLMTAAPLSLAQAAEEETPGSTWKPTSTFEGKFDWIQMKSGEWVKGEIIVMYRNNLEFDSDEFDDLTLDWADINQIHSSQVMNVGLLGQRSAIGTLILDGETVQVIGNEGTQEFAKREVLTIIAGEPKEINYWSFKVFVGLIVRSGNSDVRELNYQANIKRRTIRDRITFDLVGNQNTTDGTEITNNQRATLGWDKFLSDRFFIQPLFGEYFRDPFTNIAGRYTIGVGAGYQLVDTSILDWSFSAGPAYQETRFESVADGEDDKESTPAFVLSTKADWDITNWLEFIGEYRLQLVNEQSGTYNHHLLISLESEITKRLDFDVSWIWDRVQDPRPGADGFTPEQDDFRTTVGLTYDF